MRLLQTVKAALRAIGHAVTTAGGGGLRAQPEDGGVCSGWIGPDGRVEGTPGTAIHVSLLERFGEPTKAAFFAKALLGTWTPGITSVSSAWASIPSRSRTRSRP